jgi:Arc/MetJ-type ribon-helix-helix transcriptional regulator
MEKQVAPINMPPAMSREMEVLMESGEYPSGSDVSTDAFQAFLENKPEKKTLIGTTVPTWAGIPHESIRDCRHRL